MTTNNSNHFIKCFLLQEFAYISSFSFQSIPVKWALFWETLYSTEFTETEK